MELQEAELRNHIDPYSEGGLNSMPPLASGVLQMAHPSSTLLINGYG
jgi:hypothetical protein